MQEDFNKNSKELNQMEEESKQMKEEQIQMEKKSNLLKEEQKQMEQEQNETNFSLETVYDWAKGEKKLPIELIEQLSQITQYKDLNNDVSDTEIELAYYTYRSLIDSKVGFDSYGFPVVIDPNRDEIQLLTRLRDREQEIQKVEKLMYGKGIRDDYWNDNYVKALHSLNSIFSKEDVNEIQETINFLSLHDTKEEARESENKEDKI